VRVCFHMHPVIDWAEAACISAGQVSKINPDLGS